MEWYAIIGRETGRINQSSMCGSLEEAQRVCNEFERAVYTGERFSAESHYINVNTDEAEERPETPCTVDKTEVPADGESAVTVSDLEPGTSVSISGPATDQWTVDSGTDEIMFSTAGHYRLVVQAPFPAKEKKVVVYAT